MGFNLDHFNISMLSLNILFSNGALYLTAEFY